MTTMPVDRGFYVTSGFGPRWGTVHYGTDFGRDGGSGGHPIYAVKDGTVTAAGPASGFGQWINVDHPASVGGGLTVYGHIIPEVRVGQAVREGQRIGRINPDSRTNGGVAPHLHLEWHRYVWSPPGPDRLDPMPLLAGARWPGAAPAPTPAPTPAKGRPTQPSTTFTQLTTVDRGPRDPSTVPLIAVHTYECPRESGERALRARAEWQQTSGTGSYTVLISADGKSLRANDDNYIPCASLPTGDRLGFHVGFFGYAADSRETWLAHDDQLREAARICAEWCQKYGHEVRRLSIPEVQTKRVRGFCTHGDISVAFRESDHTDPGKNFPWDVFLRYVTEHMTGTAGQGKDWLAMATEADLRRIVREEIAAYCAPIGHDVKRLAVQMGMDADDAGFGKVPGWKQTGHRSFIDSIAAVGAQLGVPRMTDTLPELPAGARNPKLKG